MILLKDAKLALSARIVMVILEPNDMDWMFGISPTLIKNPEFVSLYNVRGSIYEQKGFYKQAVYNYERALQLSMGKDVGIKLNIARGYLKMGQRGKALNLLEEMLGETPSAEIRKVIIGMIKEAEGR